MKQEEKLFLNKPALAKEISWLQIQFAFLCPQQNAEHLHSSMKQVSYWTAMTKIKSDLKE